MNYSQDQNRAIDAIIGATADRFTMITGKAGTGKSTCLRAAIERGFRPMVLAPTGIAAINVGGVTIHRGLGIKTGPIRRGDTRAMDEPRILQNVDAIVIDEISMVSSYLLDAVNWTCQKTLGNDLPFGGIPIIAFGDMWQLPPVIIGREKDLIRDEYGGNGFWFGAKVLGGGQKPTLNMSVGGFPVETIELAEVFRQSDPEFIGALNMIRVGNVRGLDVVKRRVAESPDDAPFLCFTNSKADTENMQRLAKIDSPLVSFHASVTGEVDKASMPVPTRVDMKIGARVLVCKNMLAPEGIYLANGTAATVVDLNESWVEIMLPDCRTVRLSPQDWETKGYAYDLESDTMVEAVTGCFTQIPLRLGWAITIHKSQGMTLDKAHLTLETQAFDHGQVYVALSRVKTMAGLTLERPIYPRDLIVDPRIRERFYTAPKPVEIDFDLLEAV